MNLQHTILAAGLVLLSACAPYRQSLQMAPCQAEEPINTSYSKAAKLEEALTQLVKAGIPGATLAVISNEGYWAGAAGLASIETNTPMQPCHLQYLQSIAKTYMAVAILKLQEQGKLELDKPISQYLKPTHSQYIKKASGITVRMLLNHSSGIPEYNFSPDYVAYLLQHPDHNFTPEDYLRFIKNKDLDFEPGTMYAYRNTNYLLLALMADEITGNHAQFIADHIFKPLHLRQTFYRNDSGYPNYPTLTNSYWDRNSNGVVENVSQMQRNNVATLIGDDGIITTPHDAVMFLKGLMTGQLLKDSTMRTMTSWIKDQKGNERYGLGLTYFRHKSHYGYGHSGGGIGAGCELYYFPKQNIYMFVAINLGTVTESPLQNKAEQFRERLYDVLLD